MKGRVRIGNVEREFTSRDKKEDEEERPCLKAFKPPGPDALVLIGAAVPRRDI